MLEECMQNWFEIMAAHANLNRDKIESNWSEPGIWGFHEKGLIKFQNESLFDLSVG